MIEIHENGEVWIYVYDNNYPDNPKLLVDPNSYIRVPVSYTHLDVYKRQTLHRTFCCRYYNNTNTLWIR